MVAKVFKAKVLISCVFVIACWESAFAQTITASIRRVGETTQIEFNGRKNWVYQSPVKKENVIRAIVPKLDEKSVEKFLAWSCPFIKSVDIDRNAPDGNYEIAFNLTKNEIESFDYLTDEPTHLIFDFYQQDKKNETVAAVSEATAQAKGPVKKNKAKKKSKTVAKLPEKIAQDPTEYKKVDRSPAGSELLRIDDSQFRKPEAQTSTENQDLGLARGVYDGADKEFDRFRIKDYNISESSIIAHQQNVYIRFPFLRRKLDKFAQLMETPPIYEIKPEESEENKLARFVLEQFEKKKTGVFFETLRVFNLKFPKSKYEEVIKNVTAEQYIRQYEKNGLRQDFEDFKSLYVYLNDQYPDSPLTERNQLILAFGSLKANDGAEALRLLQAFQKQFPKSTELDDVRLGIGEAYQMLNKPQDAMRTYNALIATTVDKSKKVEATYRLGDVEMQEDQFDRAVQSYNQAQGQFPEFKGTYPNAQYNKSEAEFWLKRYSTSQEDYIEFLRLFPSHKNGGFALTRLGELLEIQGAPAKQVAGAFIEGYFRFPDSQGSEVSRLRMLSQGLRDMPEREKKRAILEIDEITKRSKLPRVEEFATLLKSEGLANRGEHQESLALLLNYYQENPTVVDKSVFKSRILRNISDILKNKINNGSYIEGLNTFGKYSTTWLKNADRIDTRYFQALAYEQADVLGEAKSIYEDLAKKLQKIEGTRELKERKVYENLPTSSQVHLRIAAIALEEKQYQDAFKHLQKTKGELSDKELVEKVQISSAVAEQMGDTKLAIENLEKVIEHFKDDMNLVIKPQMRIIALLTATGRFDDAERNLKQLEGYYEEKKSVPDENWAKVLELKGDLLFKRGQKVAAVEAYSQLLDSYESSYPLSGIRYKAGEILFDSGDLKGAEKIWSGFNGNTGELYKKLAQEKLSQAEWQDSYKKYIERIPAAENLR